MKTEKIGESSYLESSRTSTYRRKISSIFCLLYCNPITRRQMTICAAIRTRLVFVFSFAHQSASVATNSGIRLVMTRRCIIRSGLEASILTLLSLYPANSSNISSTVYLISKKTNLNVQRLTQISGEMEKNHYLKSQYWSGRLTLLFKLIDRISSSTFTSMYTFRWAHSKSSQSWQTGSMAQRLPQSTPIIAFHVVEQWDFSVSCQAHCFQISLWWLNTDWWTGTQNVNVSILRPTVGYLYYISWSEYRFSRPHRSWWSYTKIGSFWKPKLNWKLHELIRFHKGLPVRVTESRNYMFRIRTSVIRVVEQHPTL